MISSTRLRIGAVALIVAAIFVNLQQLKLKPARYGYASLPNYRTADITEIAKQKTKTKNRFGLFFELGKRFPGSTVIVPRSLWLDDAFGAGALSYGRAAHVAPVRLEANAILSDVDYEPYVVAQGQNEKQGDWFIAAARSDASVFIVLKDGIDIVLLDLSILVKSRDKPRD
jgi:hypothetical protein